jgi:site-specific recombinase XerD
MGDRAQGHRLRALIVLLWRAGLRTSETLSLQEGDLDRSRAGVLVRRRTGGKRREVGMERWAWEQLDPWLEICRDVRRGIPLLVIQRQHANLGITSIYLQGIDSSEIISSVHGRQSSTISASAGLMINR